MNNLVFLFFTVRSRRNFGIFNKKVVRLQGYKLKRILYYISAYTTSRMRKIIEKQ